MPKLRDFTISQSEKLSLSGWRQFTKKHPKLSRLFIEGGQNVNDELIEYLLQTLPLKSLRLESCDSFMFKDSTVAIISKNRGKLDELILKCPSSELSARSNEMLDEMKRNGLRYRQTTYKPSQACYSHFQFFSMTY